MTTEPELDRLILVNMRDLDATAKRIDALVKQIWMEVSKHLRNWAENHNWLASDDPDDPWVAPPDWNHDETWFSIDWGPRDGGNRGEGQAYFDLSRFAGVGGGRLCLWLNFDGVKRSVWKSLFRDAASQVSARGFSFDEAEGYYFDCTPPPGSLADAVADDDYAAAFVPLDRALEAANTTWRDFDLLLQKARA